MPYEVKVKLKEVLKSRNMTQKTLSEKTGIRPGSLSDMNRKTVINKDHLALIAEALQISDIRELVDLVRVPEK